MLRRGRMGLAAIAVVAAIAALLTPAGAAGATKRGAIVDGNARFEVITPTLIRLEYAEDGRFEGRPSLTTGERIERRGPRFSTRVGSGGEIRVIRTRKLVLRWKRSSGSFADGSLRVNLGGRKLAPKPGPNPAPLGGWRRSLDLTEGPVPLQEGMLSRAGWYLLDDSDTALLTKGVAGFAERPEREGAYQDLYLFAYGRDYARGLRDLRTLTGPSPLLPRKAFGVWFSRWWPYGADDWKGIVQRFRDERVPLDTISLDTDFKAVHDEAGAAVAAEVVGAPGEPYSWNAWDWNRDLFPDPEGFLAWAADRGLEVGLNFHPSINSNDPRFAKTQAAAGGGLVASDGCRIVQADPTGQCMVFDWADPKQLDAYMALHKPFELGDNVFHWLDWCCEDTRVGAEGLTGDTWINRAYAQRQRERGSRWPAFSRTGGDYQGGFGASDGTGAFAEHAHAIQFTGDTCGSWEMLEFTSEFTAGAASVGQPYVSHDIGSFHSVSPTGVCDETSPYLTPRFNSLPADMYVRWVQLGTFQPFLRLHSHHGKRLPWEYPGREGRIAAEFLRLRGTLNPYLYTLAAKAHEKGLPMARPMYLGWPREKAAYDHDSQFTLGEDVLVAPVAEPGNSVSKEVWFPPGTWTDWFTGERYEGPSTETIEVPLERMPVFVRAGAVIPTQPGRPTTPAGPPKRIVLLLAPGNGRGTVYDDSGAGFGYEKGRSARTAIRQKVRDGRTTLTIGRTEGDLGVMPAERTYEVRKIGGGGASAQVVVAPGERARVTVP
jgi:alpha-glucosidase (family GH31 glycosyl hydrolase)